jgi:hypothetical protein
VVASLAGPAFGSRRHLERAQLTCQSGGGDGHIHDRQELCSLCLVQLDVAGGLDPSHASSARKIGKSAPACGHEGWRDDHFRQRAPILLPGEVGGRSPRLVMAFCSRRAERLSARRPPLTGAWDIGLRHNSATTSS